MDQWVAGLTVFGGIPVGEFREHEGGGGGGELMVGFQPFRRQPLVLRGTASLLQYSRFSRDEREWYCDSANQCSYETVRYDSRYHNMWTFQFGPEFMATDGTWRPFGFALAGLTAFHSYSKFGWADQPDVSTTLLSSRNFSTSYGIGVRKVGTKHGRERGFELGFRVTRNAKASYLNEDGVLVGGNSTLYVTPREGAANVLSIHIGFWGGPYINWNERR